MATAQPLRLLYVSTGLATGNAPHLRLITTSGSVREVALDRGQLVKLIQQAAAALEVLDRDAARKAREDAGA